MGLVQVTTNYFCAGLVLEGEKIIRTAPILKWMKGLTIDQAMAQSPSHYKFYQIKKTG